MVQGGPGDPSDIVPETDAVEPVQAQDTRLNDE